jgi:hypothetical protein
MGDKISQLPVATTVDGTELIPIVQGGDTKQVTGAILRAPVGTAGGDLTGSYPNPDLAAITTAATEGSGTQIPVISVDAKGRVTSLSSVAASAPANAITALTGDVTATGPGSAAASLAAITTAQTDIGSSTTVPVISVDAKGRVTALSSAPISGSAGGTVTSITAGTGLSGGTITGSGTIAIADVTTAQTAVGDSTTIPVITVNAQGQITALTTAAAAGGVQLSDTAPANLAASAAVGTGTTAARSDHQHAFPTASEVGALGATAAAGGDLTGNFPNPTLNTVSVAKGGTGQTSYTDGQLLIGNSTGNTLSKATLTAGSNVTITNGPGTITIAASPAFQSISAYALVVGGGGGSGYNAGGGGGGGGVVSQSLVLSSGITYNVVVGAGGAASTAGTTSFGIGSVGSNSTFANITALGGGYGGHPTASGGNGGCGGGGGVPGGASGGSGSSFQGFAGGTGPGTVNGWTSGAAGGGAGSVGPSTATNSTTAPTGGPGRLDQITGVSVYYGGGGGAAGDDRGLIGGPGGIGGGGTGDGSTGNATAGDANTGGGGGGGGFTMGAPSARPGGSGVVILSVLTSQYTGTTTGSPVVTTSGDRTIIRFTSSGSYTA